MVTLLGDSILAGYLLPPELGPAARLEAELAALKLAVTVRNAGVPGDTTGGARGRMDGALKSDTAVCVVGLGGNDRGRGWPLSVTRSNLEAILVRLREKKVSTVLAASGAGRGPEASAMYAELARAHGALLYPDLMAGVGPEMRLGDRVHPNPAGAAVIARGLAPLVAQALAARA